MILYFSGTGNSLYIAKRIAEKTNDRVISIAELILEEHYELTLEPDEQIGFVYPVIACAPPDLVVKFFKKVKFNGYNNNYIYSVFTCAGTPEYTSRIMKETGEKTGYKVSGFYYVLMPGNYITKKKHLPQEKVVEYLAKCDERTDEIIEAIKRKESNYVKEKHSYLLSYVVHKLAVLEKTEKFTFSDACVRCGKCAKICSMNAITMTADKPVRDQKKCAFCLGCVNVCPTHALQVGKKTQGNPQYINPHYNGNAKEGK